MNADDTFVSLGGQGWVQTLVESLREGDLVADEGRRVVSDDHLNVQQPVVDVGPGDIVGEVRQGLLQVLVEVVSHCRKLAAFLHRFQIIGEAIRINHLSGIVMYLFN